MLDNARTAAVEGPYQGARAGDIPRAACESPCPSSPLPRSLTNPLALTASKHRECKSPRMALSVGNASLHHDGADAPVTLPNNRDSTIGWTRDDERKGGGVAEWRRCCDSSGRVAPSRPQLVRRPRIERNEDSRYSRSVTAAHVPPPPPQNRTSAPVGGRNTPQTRSLNSHRPAWSHPLPDRARRWSRAEPHGLCQTGPRSVRGWTTRTANVGRAQLGPQQARLLHTARGLACRELVGRCAWAAKSWRRQGGPAVPRRDIDRGLQCVSGEPDQPRGQRYKGLTPKVLRG